MSLRSLHRGFTRLRSKELRRGFTLIELLLVIGIIAILAAIVIVAINPTKQLADARNAQRRSDVNSILNAVYQYSIDFNGNFPSEVPATTAPIRKFAICQTDSPTAPLAWTTAQKTLAAKCIDLHELSGSYIVRVPKDPALTLTGTGTRYDLERQTNGRITVSASTVENNATISVSR